MGVVCFSCCPAGTALLVVTTGTMLCLFFMCCIRVLVVLKVALHIEQGYFITETPMNGIKGRMLRYTDAVEKTLDIRKWRKNVLCVNVMQCGENTDIIT